MTTNAHAASPALIDRLTSQSPSATWVRLGGVVLATALTAFAAQFTSPLPFTSVPFTMTPMAVLLAGAALGARRGALAQILYLAAGAAGLPVFTPSVTLPPGALRLIGPTGGYLLAYPIAAFVIGSLAERGWDRRYWTSLAAMLVGLAIIFLGGVSWMTLAFTHSWTIAAAGGFWPFIVADILKAAAAAMILPRVWRLV